MIFSNKTPLKLETHSLRWEPKVTFNELVKIMVDCELEFSGLKAKGEGQRILEEKDISWTKNALTMS